MDIIEIGTRILISCMNVKAGESVLIVTDDTKQTIASVLYQAAKSLGAEAMLVTMPPRKISGQEPPAAIAAAMKVADVVLCPMSTSITHTRAKTEAAKAGLESLPCQVSRKICSVRELWRPITILY